MKTKCVAHPRIAKRRQPQDNPEERFLQAGQGFEAFNKRAFDSLSGSGLTPFNKRAFDSLAGSGFTGFDKRSLGLTGGRFHPLQVSFFRI
ncbi:hypothetical protein COOONC_04744 [Cooperia oncophora]